MHYNVTNVVNVEVVPETIRSQYYRIVAYLFIGELAVKSLENVRRSVVLDCVRRNNVELPSVDLEWSIKGTLLVDRDNMLSVSPENSVN